MLTFEQIKEIIELVAERRLQGLEIERAGFRLKVEGQPLPQSMVQSAPATSETGTAAVSAPGMAVSGGAAGAGAGTATPAEAAASAALEGAHYVNSPIVGTFYRAPAPDTDPFVEIGSRVRKGQVLCIIEAMKLMNEIESDVDGVALRIFPQNAQAVEFGEPLFAIQAD